ncbi:hypothetical protein ZYGR_0AK02350 [Zygosaccharomyces rouxii]|uniref:Uncharacterized protein n=1 Tax=Zygosaccharomyces rouxii TaxID=4956 RepID=A0A1Q3AE32_ZYGRO|nr:hypothetical protein ZYGR_0AK02350 [Zygosaccharomyces rouxii]
MSFAGSLILTGLGAFIYKYDHDQQFERHPDSQLTVKEYGHQVFRKEGESLTKRISKASANFVNEFFDGSAFLYPNKGVQMFLTHKSDYALSMLGILAIYLLMFTLVSMFYWGTITPMYTTFFAVFGPPGMILTWIHSFLHTNMLTMMFMRLCHFNNHMVTVTLKLKGLETVYNKDPIKYYVPLSTLYFWIFFLPLKIIKYLLGFIGLITLLLISSFPVLGPPAFHLLIAPFISKAYFTKIMRLQGVDSIKRYNRIFDHFGQYAAFGSAAGLLENIPLLAGFALCTNTIGGALWGIDQKL